MPKAPNNRVYTAKQDLHEEVSSHGNGIMCVSDYIIHLSAKLQNIIHNNVCLSQKSDLPFYLMINWFFFSVSLITYSMQNYGLESINQTL